MAKQITKSMIFSLAWAMAKNAVHLHGGKSSEYFAESLRIVYAQSKAVKVGFELVDSGLGVGYRILKDGEQVGFAMKVNVFGQAKGDYGVYDLTGNVKPLFIGNIEHVRDNLRNLF